VLLLVVGVLAVAGALIALGTYYSVPGLFTSEIDQLRHLNAALGESRIVGVLQHTLVPWIQTLLGPLLPPDVRHFG
jgi:hypothetical protein